MESGLDTVLRPALASLSSPRWSPDGRTILVDGHDLRGAYGAHLVDAETGEARLVVSGTADSRITIGTVIWAPDGNAIWVDRDQQGLYAHALDTGREEELIDYRAEGLLKLTRRPALRLSPDKRLLAYSGFLREDHDAVVLRVRALDRNEPPIELLRRRTPERFSLESWSPDSRELLVSIYRMTQAPRREQEIYRVSLDDPTPRPTGFKVPGARHFELAPDGRAITFTAGAPTLQLWVMDGLAR